MAGAKSKQLNRAARPLGRSGATAAAGLCAALLFALCIGSALAQATMTDARGRRLMGPRPGVVRNEPAQIGASVMLLGKFDWELGECCDKGF